MKKAATDRIAAAEDFVRPLTKKNVSGKVNTAKTAGQNRVANSLMPKTI